MLGWVPALFILSWLTHFHPTHKIFSLDMLSSVKRLQKVCFFILLFTWMSICISNIYSRLDNGNASLNFVTKSLIPIKQALCVKYTNNTLYSANGKLTVCCDRISSSKISQVGLCLFECQENKEEPPSISQTVNFADFVNILIQIR